MFRRIAAAGAVVAVLASAGVAQAAWSKNGSGDGYAKAKTLSPPTGTATLACNNSGSNNNWTLSGWTSQAASGQVQFVVKTDGNEVQVTRTATTASWSTGAGKGTFTATVATGRNQWRSSVITSNPVSITASNGKC